MSKNKNYKQTDQYTSAEIEDLIQDEIRLRVFAKESQLEEKLKSQQIQDINLSVLEEMTDVLSKEDIHEIAVQVRTEFEEQDSRKLKKSRETGITNWLNINKPLTISIILTAFICYLGILQIEDKEMVGGLAFVGFPFVIILFGVIYAVASLFKNK